MRAPNPIRSTSCSPFDLNDAAAFTEWRARKLERYPRRVDDLVVEIRDPAQVSDAERNAIALRISTANMAIFSASRPMDKTTFLRFCALFGLHRLDKNLCADDDGVSELHDVPEGRAREYIPYSNKPISWHTDGYYNPPDQRIRAMVLHCIQPAAQGGANALLDHELLYLLLRDADPQHIAALMHPQCMTIPPNVENGVEIRPEQTGPVFSIDADTGALHLRYTARTRSIAWRDDVATHAAVRAIEGLLNDPATPILQHRMTAGQGVLCNNVLHTRTAFTDNAATGEQRLVFRARYFDRIQA